MNGLSICVSPNVGFAYEIQGITEYLTSRGVRAIPGEQVSTQELRGRNWIIRPPVRRVQPQQPTTAVSRNLPGGRYSIRFGDYVAAQRADPVHYDQNDNEIMGSDDERAIQQESEHQTQTLAVGWDTLTPSTSQAKIQFDESPPHDDDDEELIPLGYDPAYEPDDEAETDYPIPLRDNTDLQ